MLSTQEHAASLATSNLDFGTIICLADGERKQVKSVSGQNRIARCEVIEPDPSIADLLIINHDRITVGVGRCGATGPNIARIASLIEDESLMRASETGSPRAPLL
jgi:hypothetical protein